MPQAARKHVPTGRYVRSPQSTEAVCWNIPRQTTTLIRVEAQRLGTRPGALVNQIVSCYFAFTSSRADS